MSAIWQIKNPSPIRSLESQYYTNEIEKTKALVRLNNNEYIKHLYNYNSLSSIDEIQVPESDIYIYSYFQDEKLVQNGNKMYKYTTFYYHIKNEGDIMSKITLNAENLFDVTIRNIDLPNTFDASILYHYKGSEPNSGDRFILKPFRSGLNILGCLNSTIVMQVTCTRIYNIQATYLYLDTQDRRLLYEKTHNPESIRYKNQLYKYIRYRHGICFVEQDMDSMNLPYYQGENWPPVKMTHTPQLSHLLRPPQVSEEILKQVQESIQAEMNTRYNIKRRKSSIASSIKMNREQCNIM